MILRKMTLRCWHKSTYSVWGQINVELTSFWVSWAHKVGIRAFLFLYSSHFPPNFSLWFKIQTFHLWDNRLILKFPPSSEPHQRAHLYLRPDTTAPPPSCGQTGRGGGRPAAWTLSHHEHYRWHLNDPRSKLPDITSVLDGLYWSACYSKCLAASPCRAFAFYAGEQKDGPWKDVGRVS